jgi:DNA repair protein RadD
MRHPLRDYQIDGVNAAIQGLRVEKHPFIIVAATGAGKSLMIADICHQINQPILILQPNKEILEQNYQKLKGYDPNIDAGIYSASKGRKEITKFTFATIGSVYRHPELFKHFKYVLIDECHMVDPKNATGMLITFLTAIGAKHVCGLTATPYRIDQKWSRDKWGQLSSTASLKMITRISRTPFFKKILFKVETAELIKAGYLSPIKYFSESVDLSKMTINSTGADFKVDTKFENFAKSRVDRIIDAIEYSEKTNGRTLVFCQTIKQANQVLNKCLEKGMVNVAMVTGETPIPAREYTIDTFKKGGIRHVLNVGVFTTGFDMPQLDCIVMARPTISLALYYQIIGRGVRLDPANPNKVLKVYDLVGVVKRLGRVETIHVVKEAGGYRDEVWSERGRMDDVELYKFVLPPKGVK